MTVSTYTPEWPPTEQDILRMVDEQPRYGLLVMGSQLMEPLVNKGLIYARPLHDPAPNRLFPFRAFDEPVRWRLTPKGAAMLEGQADG